MKLHLSGFFIVVLVLFGCSSGTSFQGECKRDSDCEMYERCDTLDFRCVCASDEACAHGEYCNASGSCQVKSGCYTNNDCAQGSICDVLTGECIASNSCSEDYHCDLDKICVDGECRLGCKDTSDCELQRREVCIDGQCISGKCENTRYCDFGLVCHTESHECVQPADGYCADGCDPLCSSELCPNVGDSPCGLPSTICAGFDQSNSHCWVACDPDEDSCPSGYICKPTTFSWATCASDADCSEVINTCGASSHRCALNQQVCDSDADCLDFGTAVCVSGYCVVGYHCEPPSGC